MIRSDPGAAGGRLRLRLGPYGTPRVTRRSDTAPPGSAGSSGAALTRAATVSLPGWPLCQAGTVRADQGRPPGPRPRRRRGTARPGRRTVRYARYAGRARPGGQ
eukprot:765703-Hanusia_phi.AAC.1